MAKTINNHINYSIIIPHKNIPSLLQRCLNSIPKRDDIQIIVVDDNSDVNLVNFECFPGVNDKCIEVYFTKEGKGAGYARNVGLSHAKGKWLFFADADDFFNTNFLSTIDKYCESDYDIIYFGINSVYSDSLKMAQRGHIINTYIEKDLYNNSKFENSRFKRYSPWAKMISNQLVTSHNMLFEERIASNDIWFSIQTGFYAKNVYADQTPIYCLTIRKGSLEMTTTFLICEERFSAACKVNDFFYKNDLNRFRYNLWRYIPRYRQFGFHILFKKIKQLSLNYKNKYNLLIIDFIKTLLKL